MVCLNRLHAQQYVCCPVGHIVCELCFDGFVAQVATDPNRLQRGKQLPCPSPHCHQFYAQENVMIHTAPATTVAFLQLALELERAGAAAAAAAQQMLEQERLAAQALPTGWTFRSGSPWTRYTPHEQNGPVLVEVERTSPEFQHCQERFQQAGMTVALKQVERVQNPELWTKYRKATEAIEHLGREKNEKWLFYGTGKTDPKHIASQTGIDFRYSNPGLFGRGAYFAERSNYSCAANYIHTTARGERQLFLAQVAAGRAQSLGKSQRDRTIRHPAPGCDSIRGHVLDPDYYAVIVYDVSQSYPAYLLTY